MALQAFSLTAPAVAPRRPAPPSAWRDYQTFLAEHGYQAGPPPTMSESDAAEDRAIAAHKCCFCGALRTAHQYHRVKPWSYYLLSVCGICGTCEEI